MMRLYNTTNCHYHWILSLLELWGVTFPLFLSLSISASRNVFCSLDHNLSVFSEVFWSSHLAISVSPASGIEHDQRISIVSDLLHDNISASATDPSTPSTLPLMFRYFSEVLLQSTLNSCIHPSLVMALSSKALSMFRYTRQALCAKPAAT